MHWQGGRRERRPEGQWTTDGRSGSSPLERVDLTGSDEAGRHSSRCSFKLQSMNTALRTSMSRRDLMLACGSDLRSANHAAMPSANPPHAILRRLWQHDSLV